LSSVSAYRPVSVLHRLPPHSEACPLSARHLLRARGPSPAPLPFVVSPLPAIARAALRAAREAAAVVGIALPRARDLRGSVDPLLRDADALAPGLPFAIAVELAVEGGDAVAEAERLVELGATHVAIDAPVDDVDVRAAVREVAALLAERELGVELLLRGDDAPPLAAALRADGVAFDLVGVRCARPRDLAAARAQLGALERIAEASGGPVCLHGPSSPELQRLLAGTAVHACDDGGAALAAGLRALPAEERARLEAGDERAAGREASDRIEALAWSELTAFLEALGAAGSARSLAARLAEGL
jgi:hypothetical protein